MDRAPAWCSGGHGLHLCRGLSFFPCPTILSSVDQDSFHKNIQLCASHEQCIMTISEESLIYESIKAALYQGLFYKRAFLSGIR